MCRQSRCFGYLLVAASAKARRANSPVAWLVYTVLQSALIRLRTGLPVMESPRGIILTVDWRSASFSGAAVTVIIRGSAAQTEEVKLKKSMSVIPIEE
jgi:hypothetical protein